MIEERWYIEESRDVTSEPRPPSPSIPVERRVIWSDAFVMPVMYGLISFRTLSGPLARGCTEQDLYIPPSIRDSKFVRMLQCSHVPTEGKRLTRFRFLDIKGSFSQGEILAEVMREERNRPGTYEELLAIRHDVRSADGADTRYVISLGSVMYGVREFWHPFLYVEWLPGTQLRLEVASPDNLFAPTFETTYPGISRRFLVACED